MRCAPVNSRHTGIYQRYELVWGVYSNKCPAAECERSELAPIARGSWASEAAVHVFQALAQHYLRAVRLLPTGGGSGNGTGNGWVRVKLLVFFCGASTPKQNRRGLVCTLWQFSSLSAIDGSRSFAFNITIFIAFNLLRFRFNLLIKTNKL